MTTGGRLLLAGLVSLTAIGCSSSSTDGAGPEPGSPTVTTTTPSTTPTTAPTTAGTAPPAVRRPEPPAGRACYRLTLAQATRPTSDADPVPCRRPHTTRTVHVGRLDLVVAGRQLAVDSDRAQRQLAATCPARLTEVLGGSTEARRLSRFEVVWFSPTLVQAARGARWFRCDVIALGDENRLLPLPSTRLEGLLDRPGALATYGLCGTAAPGSPGFRRVACGLRHSWVAISTLDLPGGRRYPGIKEVRAAGDDVCAERVRARNGSLLTFRYGWEWPTAAQWSGGRRYGYCWAPAELA